MLTGRSHLNQRRLWIPCLLGTAIACGYVIGSGRFAQGTATPERVATTTEIGQDLEVALTSSGQSAARKQADSSSTDKPIDVIQQRLEPLARRRDLKASVELSRAAIRCYKTAEDIAMLQRRINTDTQEADPLAKEARDRDLTARIEAIRDFGRTHCDTMSRETLEALTRFAAKNAAALGDADAQMCVIQQRFLEPRHDLSPDERQHGWDYIAAYEASAFERGDWRIVSLMVARTLSSGHGPIVPHLSVAASDPFDYFRAMLLLRRGAVGEYADKLDGELAQFIEKDNPEMRRDGLGLTDEDMSGAKAWAQEQFDSHFATSPPLSEAPVACGDY